MKALSQVKNWKEFLKEWGAVETEAGAVGLLFAGAKLKESGERTDTECGHDDHARCFTAKVSFFLDLKAPENPILETTARRLVMNVLLEESLGLSWTGLIASPHARLVEFLGVVHEDLRKKPFPKKAHEFLFQSFSKWRAKDRQREAPRGYKRVGDDWRDVFAGTEYDQTEPLVRACVAWGALPGVLMHLWFSSEMIEEIRVVAEPLILTSLGDEDDLQKARLRGSLSWAMQEDPPRELFGEDGRTKLWKLNGLTLHYLRSC